MSDNKKKFKDTDVGKFLLSKIPNVVGAIAGQTPVGNVIQAIIGGSDMSDADKQVALEKLKNERAEIDGVTRRWVADARSASWLAQNVRPLTLAFFSIAYVVGWFYGLELSSITGLLSVIVGGYFGSRGVEKVFGNKLHK
jgi:ribulose 1,5-bisphosphate carboxylase large subunit-like protein